MKCVKCLPILGYLVKGCEDWLYCDVSGNINIDLSCSGHTGQLSIIANGLWSPLIVLSLCVPFLHYFNIKMTNENLNILRYKDPRESHLFLKIFWIMGRKHVFIQDWLFCRNFVLFSTLSVFILSCNHCLCYGLSGCCSCLCKSLCFQREASLCFTLMRNGEYNCYSYVLTKAVLMWKWRILLLCPLCIFQVKTAEYESGVTRCCSL